VARVDGCCRRVRAVGFTMNASTAQVMVMAVVITDALQQG
jgi:hypothetical protein